MNHLTKIMIFTVVVGLLTTPINLVAAVGDLLFSFGANATLKGARGVDVDPDGRVYVADYYDGVIVFNTDGSVHKNFDFYQAKTPTTAIRVDQTGNVYSTSYQGGTQIFNPDGVQIGHIPVASSWPSSYTANDSFGKIYVTDPSQHKIKVFDSTGTLISEWGTQGNADGQLDSPTGIGIGPDNLIYIADSNNNRIQVFDVEGNFVMNWGASGSNPGQFNTPMGLDISSDGKIVVADRYNHRVQVFDLVGNTLQVIVVGIWVVDAAIDSDGTIYVPHDGNNEIMIYSPDGTLVDKMGGPSNKDGQFNNPINAAVDHLGRVYITDSGNHRIQVFDNKGQFLWKFGSYGVGDGQFNGPFDIDFDTLGNIYVTDTGNHRVQVFDDAGNYLRQFGSYGAGIGQMNGPRGIAVRNDGIIIITEWGNKRVQTITNDGMGIHSWQIPIPEDWPISASVPLGIDVDNTGNIFVGGWNTNRILVYNDAGEILRQWGAAQNTFSFNLSNPYAIHLTESGVLYVAEWFGWEANSWDTFGNPLDVIYHLEYPTGIAADFNDRVYIVQPGHHRVYAVAGRDYTPNSPPVLQTIGDQKGYEGQLLEFAVTATDPENDTLTFSASNLPAGSTFDPETAIFSWIPDYDQAGSYTNVEFSVADDGEPIELDAELITITVGKINRTPLVTAVSPQHIMQYEDLQFTVTAVDPDGDSIIDLYVDRLPSGASFDPAIGLFFWRPDGSQEGVYPVSFYAVDDGVPSQTGQTDVVITVGEVESPSELTDIIIDDIVTDPDLSEEVENSYIANLKKVNIFIESGKITPAVNQLETFIQKVQQDVNHGMISPAKADLFIMMAQDVIDLLRGS